MGNPRVFFDITIDGANAGRIVMELRADVVPKTAGMISDCEAAAAFSRLPIWIHVLLRKLCVPINLQLRVDLFMEETVADSECDTTD